MNKKTTLLLLVSVFFCFIILIAFSNHKCDGEHCHICDLIYEVNNGISFLYLNSSNLVVIIISIIFIGGRNYILFILNKSINTLFGLKVRLNN